ncbi:MAG: hypothetical protein GF311_05880 [Candidatus Lokiarchaeota archaeon]|nr:hypothetical protein [Candidatus Lokiarchaeota archaeon]
MNIRHANSTNKNQQEIYFLPFFTQKATFFRAWMNPFKNHQTQTVLSFLYHRIDQNIMEYRKDAHRVYSLMVHVISGVKSRQPAFIEGIDIIEA